MGPFDEKNRSKEFLASVSLKVLYKKTDRDKMLYQSKGLPLCHGRREYQTNLSDPVYVRQKTFQQLLVLAFSCDLMLPMSVTKCLQNN